MNIQKDIKNIDGTTDTLVITSNDNSYPLDSTKTYKLANRVQSKENNLTQKFKNSILGTEVGVKAEGFSNIAILATIIAIASMIIMYILWRL